MKKTAYLLFLSLLGFNVATAQDLGVFYGFNTNMIHSGADRVSPAVTGNNIIIQKEYDYVSKLGTEVGLTYRTELNHSWSLEHVASYLVLNTSIQETTTSTPVPDANHSSTITVVERDFEQKSLVYKPRLHYWINDNWTFMMGASVRLALSGSYYKYNEPTDSYIYGIYDAFEFNHINANGGVNYESDYGIGVFAEYQLPVININGVPTEYYDPKGTLTFGISYRFDKDKLNKYSK